MAPGSSDRRGPAVQKAFAGTSGYETCRPLTVAKAAGELEIFHEAGYRALIGLLGANSLFNTPLDRAEVATILAILEPAARGYCDLLASFA